MGTSFQATYAPASNHLTTVGALIPTYDANGNLTNDTAHSYQWDADGNMIGVDVGQATGSCVYFDALDRMVEHGKGTGCGTYDQVLYGPGGTKLAIMSGQALVKAFLPLPGSAQAIYTTAGLQHYRRPDWLGSSRLSTTTTAGAKYYDVEYAPYGENYGGTTGTGGAVDLTFTGQNQDTVTTFGGLYDFLYREYNPVQGRWISPDPAGRGAVNPMNPQSWNRFAYVNNRPLNHTDPQGLDDGGGGGDWGGGWGDGGWSEQLPIYTGPALDPSWIIWNYHTDEQGNVLGDYAGELMCSGVEGSTQPCVAWDPIDDLWYQAPNPCARSGRALDPGVYQAAGEAAQSNFVKDLSNLYQFRAGGRFDAQPLGGSPSYANYVYGVYTAAAGYTLDQALAGADIYAQYRSRYPAGTPMDSPDHPFTPAPNVRNITAGFNSEQNGTLCHKQQ